MSILSVSGSPSVAPPAPVANTPNKTLETSSDSTQPSQADGSADDSAYVYQPTPPAPLPPGQGTRVDQLA